MTATEGEGAVAIAAISPWARLRAGSRRSHWHRQLALACRGVGTRWCREQSGRAIVITAHGLRLKVAVISKTADVCHTITSARRGAVEPRRRRTGGREGGGAWRAINHNLKSDLSSTAAAVESREISPRRSRARSGVMPLQGVGGRPGTPLQNSSEGAGARDGFLLDVLRSRHQARLALAAGGAGALEFFVARRTRAAGGGPRRS